MGIPAEAMLLKRLKLWRLPVGLACSGALLLAACVTTPTTKLPESLVKFPAEAVPFGVPGNLKQTILFRPSEGAGPFPAVVLASTCAGVGRHIYDWAERLTGSGYVVLIVDSFTPRGVSDNCRPAWEATVSLDVANADVAAGLAHLRALPYVKGDSLGIAGFSFGAIATIKLASASYQRWVPGGVQGLKAIAFFYGACSTSSRDPSAQAAYSWADDVVIPVAAFLGEIDDEAPARPCAESAERLKARGKDVTYRVYPKTTHSFDSRVWGTQGRSIYHGARGPFLYRYNPEATEESWRDMKALFDRELKGMK